MRNIERTRLREQEPAPANDYEISYQYLLKLRERGFTGQIVMAGETQPWQYTRQGAAKWYLTREHDLGAALKDWNVFLRDIQKHNGKHQHQGGLVIFVLEGAGYSIIDDERVDWEAGDLLLLPIKPEGCVHQHFNRNAEESCKWIAFIFRPYQDQIAYYIDQKETVPDFKP